MVKMLAEAAVMVAGIISILVPTVVPEEHDATGK